MRYLPNILSLLRIPLAFVFLQDDTMYRCIAVLLAMVTDGLDGYIARKYHVISKLGTILDPITDKFFVLMVLAVLLTEQQLSLWQVLAMLSRDFAIIVFGCYLVCQGKLNQYQFRAIWWGKITTAYQLALIVAVLFHYPIPNVLYFIFIVLGFCALIELYATKQHKAPSLQGQLPPKKAN